MEPNGANQRESGKPPTDTNVSEPKTYNLLTKIKDRLAGILAGALLHTVDASIAIAVSIGLCLCIFLWQTSEALLDNIRTPVVTLIANDSAPLVRIPSGELEIADTSPPARKKIEGFYLQQHDVTNAMFDSYLKSKCVQLPPGPPSLLANPPDPPDWSDRKGLSWRTLLSPNAPIDMPTNPVIGVSWDDATSYCKSFGMRLPTADEWLYAERGGGTTAYWWGDRIPRYRKVGNFADAALLRTFPTYSNYTVVPEYDDGFTKTSPVGYFGRGPWGLEDMDGDVWQWVDKESPACPDQKPEGIKQKPRAGGAWSTAPIMYGVSSSMNCVRETMRSDDTGFRCARDVTLPPTAAAHVLQSETHPANY